MFWSKEKFIHILSRRSYTARNFINPKVFLRKYFSFDLKLMFRNNGLDDDSPNLDKFVFYKCVNNCSGIHVNNNSHKYLLLRHYLRSITTVQSLFITKYWLRGGIIYEQTTTSFGQKYKYSRQYWYSLLSVHP